MKVAAGLIAVILGAVPFIGFCQGPSAGPCDKPRTTIEMRECAAYKLKNAEQDLEEVCAVLLLKLPDDGHKKSFVASQEAWLKYRDAEAEFEGSFYAGGTIQPQVKLYSMARITEARVKELRQVVNDELGR